MRGEQPEEDQVQFVYINPDAGINKVVGRCCFIHGWNSAYYSGPKSKGKIQYFTQLRWVNIDGGYDDEGCGDQGMIDGYEFIYNVCLDHTTINIWQGPYSPGCECDDKLAISDPERKYDVKLKTCEFELILVDSVEGEDCPCH